MIVRSILSSNTLAGSLFLTLLCAIYLAGFSNYVSHTQGSGIKRIGYFARIYSCMDDGDLAMAANWCNKFVSNCPSCIEAYTLSGSVFSKIGNYQKARQDYENAISLLPCTLNDLDAKATAYAELGHYQKGLDEATLSIFLGNGFSLLTRSQIYCKLGKFREAIEDSNKFLDPSVHFASSQVYLNRGEAYLRVGLPELAISDLTKFICCTKSIENRDSNAEAYHLRAEAYRKLGQIRLAESDEQKYKDLIN